MSALITGVELWLDARRELVEAFEWYEQHNPIAAADFLDEVESVCRALVDSPHMGREWPGLTVRRALLRRFPYAVIYLPRDPIEIVAIAHGRRRPGYWRERL